MARAFSIGWEGGGCVWSRFRVGWMVRVVWLLIGVGSDVWIGVGFGQQDVIMVVLCKLVWELFESMGWDLMLGCG